MTPGDVELEWSPSGPGVRLRGSPLWFDAWPGPGVGFLSSLDALGRRRLRGQVLCRPEMLGLLGVLRPGAQALPLVGTLGLGRLRLAAEPTGGTPGASCLWVERGSARLLYLREGDEDSLVEHWGSEPGRSVGTLLVGARDPVPMPPGVEVAEEVPEARLPGLESEARDRGEAICLVVEGPGSALRVLQRLGQTTDPIGVPARIPALCRVGRRQGLDLPPVRAWDGRDPLPPGAMALWIASGDRPVPEAGFRGGIRSLRVVFGGGPVALARLVRVVRAARLVLWGPGAPRLRRQLADLGLEAEVLAPPLDPGLF